MKKPYILFDLHTSKKFASNSHIMKQTFYVLQLRYTEYQHIYTDGTKDGEKAGCTFYMDTTSVLYEFLMALLCLLQKQKQ